MFLSRTPTVSYPLCGRPSTQPTGGPEEVCARACVRLCSVRPYDVVQRKLQPT